MNEPVPKSTYRIIASVSDKVIVPAVIADAGEQAARRFVGFFAVMIRNKNTRMASYRAACSFSA